MFLIIHHTWKYFSKKLIGLEAIFSPTNIRNERSPGDEFGWKLNFYAEIKVYFILLLML